MWALEFSKIWLLHKHCFHQIDKLRERNKRVHGQGEKNSGPPVPAPSHWLSSQSSYHKSCKWSSRNLTSKCDVHFWKQERQKCTGLYKDLSVFFLVWQHISLHHFMLNVVFVMTKLLWIDALLFYAPDGPRPAMGLRCKCFNKKDCYGHQRLHRDIKFLD